MHIRRHNLISLSFISQRSTHREDMRIIAFMFCFTRHAEREMQSKRACVGNVWSRLKAGDLVCGRLKPSRKHRRVCRPYKNLSSPAAGVNVSVECERAPAGLPQPAARNLEVVLVESQFGRGDIERLIFHQRPHQPNYSPVWGAENIPFVK